MLAHPTLDLLHALGLHGMAKGYQEIAAHPEARALDHAEWLGLLLEHEVTLRRQKRFETRARAARLRHPASVEDVDYRTHRGLDRALFLKLAACDWIRCRRNVLITGPCGVGKSWLACALGHKACREDLSVLYYRVPRLFAALALARGDGRYGKLLRQLARVNLLILDDWGPEPLLPEQARDLLEIVEDRYDAGSLLITSQVPVDRWYDMIGIPTLADAVLDRVVHNAYRIELSGESLRKRKAPEPAAAQRPLDLPQRDHDHPPRPAGRRRPGRLQIGMVAGFTSEQRPASDRYPRPASSEYPPRWSPPQRGRSSCTVQDPAA